MRQVIFDTGENNIVNRNLIAEIGEAEAVVYDVLLYKNEYWKKQGKLSDDEFFFITDNDIIFETLYQKTKVRKAISTLIKFNLIEKILKGVPAKNHYRIIENEELLNKLIERGRTKREELLNKLKEDNKKDLKRFSQSQQNSQFAEKQQTSLVKNNNQDCLKTTVTNNNITNNKTNNKYSISAVFETNTDNIISILEKEAEKDNRLKNLVKYLKLYFENEVEPETDIEILKKTWIKEKSTLDKYFRWIDKIKKDDNINLTLIFEKYLQWFFDVERDFQSLKIKLLTNRVVFLNFFKTIFREVTEKGKWKYYDYLIEKGKGTIGRLEDYNYLTQAELKEAEKELLSF